MSHAAGYWDGSALVIVLAGTWLATAARCGLPDMVIAFKTLIQLGGSGFDKNANRAALARCVPEINRRGPLCADTPLPPDRSIAKLVERYLISGSIDELRAVAKAQRTRREITVARAVQVFDYAGEQAPVFGLVGTLFALTQINPASGAAPSELLMAGVGTAVLSSLYGVLTAHLLCAPLASAIERRGADEEAERSELIEWFQDQLTNRRATSDRPIASIPLSDVA